MCPLRLLPLLGLTLPALIGLRAVQADAPAVTVYNQDFGVVRERIRLDLAPGVNELRITDVTAHLEPDSVILRDPADGHILRILEQNYRSDPLSQELLLSLFEGRTIDFVVQGKGELVQGRIVRSGYVPHQQAWARYGPHYQQSQRRMAYGPSGQPIIEVDGRLRFSLPGIPLFPSLGDDTILKPTLHWVLETNAAGEVEAELSYVTGGMNWEADYSLVAGEADDMLDVVGLVTIDNQSGRTFEQARIKLMAGDVHKIRPRWGQQEDYRFLGMARSGGLGGPPVTEKTFDEYHLYTLHRPTTLRDRETKQVEFLRADGIRSQRIYVYDGVFIDQQHYHGWPIQSIRQERSYGVRCNPKVWVMRELANTEENGLGMPLPAGRVRFYRRDDDGQLEFTGESNIDHTPQDETPRVYTGAAFDLKGERRRLDYKLDPSNEWLDESFEIVVRNHKNEAVEVRVVEHLYRWPSWEIRHSSQEFIKTDSNTVEFRVTVEPNGESQMTYLVHYAW